MPQYYLHHKSEAILTYSNVKPAEILTTATNMGSYVKRYEPFYKHILIDISLLGDIFN